MKKTTHLLGSETSRDMPTATDRSSLMHMHMHMHMHIADDWLDNAQRLRLKYSLGQVVPLPKKTNRHGNPRPCRFFIPLSYTTINMQAIAPSQRDAPTCHFNYSER
jgi:hypothetical protein